MTITSPIIPASTDACVLHAAGDLRIEARTLSLPGPGEVLVAMAAGGICGSDLHYFLDGGFGVVRVREPIILGHEVAGHVAMLGEGVSRAGLAVGATVAVNPSHPCGSCAYCQSGDNQHCAEMRFFGSAMRMPHVQGGFRRHMIVRAEQCVPVAPHVRAAEAAMTEPLAVALHALKQGGDVRCRSVLVTGAGPIGLLVLLALRHAGAGSVAITDIVDAPLATALRLGADEAVNIAREALAPPEGGEKGRFDLVFECSGSPAALASAIALARPRATIVQVGVGGSFDVPMNAVVAKELRLVGSFRFHPEFEQAAELISSGAIDVSPLITATAPLADAVAAFRLASDRSRSIKVQLSFA